MLPLWYITTWWLSYPSEKYESQWEGWHPIYSYIIENEKCLKPPTTIIYQVFGGTWNGLGPKLTKQCGFPETTNCPKPLVVARRLVSHKPDDCLRFAEESAEKYPHVWSISHWENAIIDSTTPSFALKLCIWPSVPPKKTWRSTGIYIYIPHSDRPLNYNPCKSVAIACPS